MIWYCNWKTKRLFSFYMKSHETKDRTRVQTYKMVNAPLMVISKMQNVWTKQLNLACFITYEPILFWPVFYRISHEICTLKQMSQCKSMGEWNTILSAYTKYMYKRILKIK